MSLDNVETVRRAFALFNDYGAGGAGPEAFDRLFEQFAAIATADFEYHDDPHWPGAQVHRGLDRYREWMQEFYETLDEMSAEIEGAFDAGDRVVVFVRWWARGSLSGAEAEIRPGQVFTLREGKIAKQEIFLDRDDALRAAGIELG